jgi:RHS repeat-associated protein
LAAEYETVAQSADCTTCYLTTDPLGSTRVITDGNGNVVSRHDYYPFGEELATSNRTSALQYGVTDYVAQRFTGKERDGETGLDYFGARYFSGAQGRFTSPDQPFIDQDPADPQSWNLYAYGRNNPLAFVDPTGQYVCGSNISKDECATFQKSLDQAQTAANALKDKYGADSKQYTTAQRAIDAYGKAGVDNGVTVDVGNTGKYGAITTVAGAAGPKTADNPTGQKINVTFGTGVLSDARPTLAAHEGSHVADGSDWVRSGFSAAMNPTRYQTELNAYQVQSNVGQGLGWQFQTVRFAGSAPYLLNVQGWAPSNTSNVINAILKQQYGLLPTDQRRAFHKFVKVTR